MADLFPFAPQDFGVKMHIFTEIEDLAHTVDYFRYYYWVHSELNEDLRYAQISSRKEQYRGQSGFNAKLKVYAWVGMSQPALGYRLTNQVPPISLSFSNITSSTFWQFSWILYAIMIPEMPQPMHMTLSGRLPGDH